MIPPARRSELLAAGLTDDELRTAVRRNRLTRMARGLYVDTARHAELTADQRYLARVLALSARNPGLVVSHHSAAALHGLPLLAPDAEVVHLTRPGTSGHRHDDTLVVHTGRLAGDDLVVRNGHPCTAVARTVLDVARTSSLRDAVVLADAALQRELTTPTALAAELAEALHRKGRPRAVRALGRVDGRSESPGETLMRLALDGQGLPALELQIEIRDELGHLVGRADGGFVEHGVLLEFDGLIKYASRRRPGESASDAVVREKLREQRLTELGWLVTRVIWAELRDPKALIRRIERAIARRDRLVAAGFLHGTARPYPPVRVLG